MATRYILSVDGGGLRGIIPALVLAELEAQTGRPAAASFDFLAGTSTGAIIAAGLAAGLPAREIVHLYADGSRQVLDERWWMWPIRQARFYLHRGWQYDSAALYRLIDAALGERCALTLNDAPGDLLISAKHVDTGVTWHFTNDPPEAPAERVRTGSLRLTHCVVASAAEPMFFSPWAVNDDPARHDPRVPTGWFVDGGVGFQANPVYHACVEAFDHRGGRYLPEETIVVSLGTGLGRETLRPRGLARWIRWTFREIGDASVEQQTDLVRRYFRPRAFYRVNVDLGGVVRRDRRSSLGRLQRAGRALAEALDWPAMLAGAPTPFSVPEWPAPVPPPYRPPRRSPAIRSTEAPGRPQDVTPPATEAPQAPRPGTLR